MRILLVTADDCTREVETGDMRFIPRFRTPLKRTLTSSVFSDEVIEEDVCIKTREYEYSGWDKHGMPVYNEVLEE